MDPNGPKWWRVAVLDSELAFIGSVAARTIHGRFLSLFDVEPSITSSVMKQKVFLGVVVGLMTALPGTAAERLETLPQTKPLEWEEIDLSARLMDGAHRFIERKIE